MTMMTVSSDVLRRIHNILGVTDREWADRLKISRLRSTRDLLSRPTLELDERVIEDLADELELLPEALTSGQIDFTAVARRQAGNPTWLPEVYSKGALSRLRTSIHILDEVEARAGWKVRHRILKKFQLNESIVADPDMKVSVRFISDLCLYLLETGIKERALYELGKSSVVANYNSPLGELFRQQGSPRALLEFCFVELINKFYDENFIYKLTHIDENSCTVEAFCSSKAMDATGMPILGNAGTCAARAGTFASLTGYLNLPNAMVTETRCIHRGDPRCRYEIDFGLANTRHAQGA